MFSGNPEVDVSQTRGLVMETGGGGEDSNQDALARSRCLVMNSGSKEVSSTKRELRLRRLKRVE